MYTIQHLLHVVMHFNHFDDQKLLLNDKHFYGISHMLTFNNNHDDDDAH